jgi:CRISPR system Cascade subunit CasE
VGRFFLEAGPQYGDYRVTHLTQAFVDYKTAAKRRLLDTYAWHKAVWQAFPGRESDNRDFLTRLDRLRDGFRLLMVSPQPPSMPDWCPTPENWQTKVVPISFFSGSQYLFQLCANPTRKVHTTRSDGALSKNGRRVPLTSHDELVAWLERKAAEGGFRLHAASLQAVPKGREYFSKRGQLGLHSAVEFRGTLSIVERQKFYDAFRRGIGSAKAFGFGLLYMRA